MQRQKIAPENAYRTLLTLWGALLMSQFIFFAVVFAAKPELLKFDLSRSPLGGQGAIVPVFAVAAIACIVIGLVLKKRNIDRSVAEKNVGLVQTGMIIGCALAEASTLIGVFLAFAFNYQYFFFFLIAGIFGILLNFPRRGDVDAALFRDQI